MALPLFDQRPAQFTSLGYPGSRYVQPIELQGFPDGAVVTALLWAYNTQGIPALKVEDAYQPAILPVDARNRKLVLQGPQTSELTDPSYWMEYLVDGTVHGVTPIKFTRELATTTPASAEKITLSAGVAGKLVLRNPDALSGFHVSFQDDPANDGFLIEHNLNTDLLIAYAYTAAGILRSDVTVIPLRGVPGKSTQNWGRLSLPPSADVVTDLIIHPHYR